MRFSDFCKKAGILFIALCMAFSAGCRPGKPRGEKTAVKKARKEIENDMREKIPHRTERVGSEKAETYQNPMEIKGQHGKSPFTGSGEYGIGDPFVMRYNGRYYLYPSSCENRVRVYESVDLVHWEYKGYATEGDDVYFAYAPEVVYYDGSFYMCTSPEGKGHFILKSESPLGPFRPVTDNFGHSIDGSFWITDDEDLFFLYPGENRIHSARLDPATMLPSLRKVDLNATLHGWTEGPGMFRRGKYHYLTYTGNHVLSTGYRVAYSYTGDNPFGQYIMPEDNILFLRSEQEDPFHGLGHSSNVTGPDLDSIYSPYHNLVALDGPQRRYDLDRLMTNGGLVYSTGDTSFPVPVPSMPSIYGWLDEEDPHTTESFMVSDQGILSNDRVPGVFTAEYHFRLSGEKCPVDLKFGIDGDSWWAVRVDTENNTLSLVSADHGVEKRVAMEKIRVHNYQRLCTVRVENTPEVTYVYWNGARKLALHKADIPGGKIGASGSHAIFGYIAANGEALGSGDFDGVKNLPGKFAAMHYLKGENRGFHIRKAAEKEDGLRPGEKESSMVHRNGSHSLVLNTPGDWTEYSVNAAEDGLYGVTATLGPESSGAVCQWIVDEDPGQAFSFTVPETGLEKEDLAGLHLGNLELEKGFHTLTLCLLEGELRANMFEFHNITSRDWDYDSQFSIRQDRKEWLLLGPWKMQGGKLAIKGEQDGMAVVGKPGMMDYEMDLDMEIPRKGSGESGVMFRVTNPSRMDAQVRESFTGYGLSIGEENMTFCKYNYGKIGTSRIIRLGENHSDHVRLRVVVQNNRIRIYRKGEKKPAMDFYDPRPWLYGRIGFYSFGRELTVRHLSVKPIPFTNSSIQ